MNTTGFPLDYCEIDYLEPFFASWSDTEEFAKTLNCTAWYCERNGDPIGCLATPETLLEDLPKTFSSYAFLPWEDISNWPPDERYILNTDGSKRFM